MASDEEQPGCAAAERWPGWPGDCVFRVIVPVSKVGSIIGRKGELIKKMCDETGARIRVLDGPIGNPDRVVLISGKEDPLLPLSPAMDATLRVFRRVSGLSDDNSSAAGFSSVRLQVASTQAINLIGKQGSLIKSIQDSTGSSVRVLSPDEAPIYASADERLVELQGEASKVLKALQAVVSHLRKFLVDHSVLPLFEKTNHTAAPAAAATAVPERPQVDAWTDGSATTAFGAQAGFGIGLGIGKREPMPPPLYLDREAQLDSHFGPSGISLYGQDPTLSGIRAVGLARPGAPIVTQITQTMQIPLSYAEDIIGIEGSNIAYIRRTSGAILTIQESRGLPDEITVEIKGTAAQVQLAQQLIQEVMSNHHKELIPNTAGYARIDPGLRSSYAQLNASSYPPTSLPSQPYAAGGYGSSGVGGGYNTTTTFRL